MFDDLWSNTDETDRGLAVAVLAGDLTWLEEGVFDTSRPGPWIAPAEPGPSERPNMHRSAR